MSKQGIVVVPLEDIFDAWDRAFLLGIATNLYGDRTAASRKSTPWAEGDVIDRGDGETWTVIATTPKSVTLRRSRDGALDAVGGSGSPAGSALWYVAGLGQSVREWALRQGWAGKAISLHEANQNVEPSVVSFTQKQVKVIRGPSCQGYTESI